MGPARIYRKLAGTASPRGRRGDRGGTGRRGGSTLFLRFRSNTFFEFLHGSPERFREVRELASAKEHQDNHEDKQQLLVTQTEHNPVPPAEPYVDIQSQSTAVASWFCVTDSGVMGPAPGKDPLAADVIRSGPALPVEAVIPRRGSALSHVRGHHRNLRSAAGSRPSHAGFGRKLRDLTGARAGSWQ